MADGTDDALVFPGRRKGQLLRRCTVDVHFAKFCKDAGLPKMRVHDMRHTLNSLLDNWGIQRQEIDRAFGWTPGSDLGENTYRHQTDDTLRNLRSDWKEIGKRRREAPAQGASQSQEAARR